MSSLLDVAIYDGQNWMCDLRVGSAETPHRQEACRHARDIRGIERRDGFRTDAVNVTAHGPLSITPLHQHQSRTWMVEDLQRATQYPVHRTHAGL